MRRKKKVAVFLLAIGMLGLLHSHTVRATVVHVPPDDLSKITPKESNDSQLKKRVDESEETYMAEYLEVKDEDREEGAIEKARTEIQAMFVQEELFLDKTEEEYLEMEQYIKQEKIREKGQLYFLLKYRLITDIALCFMQLDEEIDAKELDKIKADKQLAMHRKWFLILTNEMEALWGDEPTKVELEEQSFVWFYQAYMQEKTTKFEVGPCDSPEEFYVQMSKIADDLKIILEIFEDLEEETTQQRDELVLAIMQKIEQSDFVLNAQENSSVKTSVQPVPKVEANQTGDETETVEQKGRMIQMETKALPVARIGNKYYNDFNEAFNALQDGGTIYVLRDCKVRHITTRKSFSLYPEGANVTMTFDETSSEPAGIICTEEGWQGKPVWLLGGKDGFTLTLNANGRGTSGVLSSYGATIQLKRGLRLTNASGNGVWNHAGVTNVEEGVRIYNNGSHGIATFSTINVYGGEIYGNAYDGVRAQTAINLFSGSIHHNGHCGVHVGEGNCTFKMNGGSVYQNQFGVGNFNGKGEIHLSGGQIYGNSSAGITTRAEILRITERIMIRDNTGPGVAIYGGEAVMTGGIVTGNTGSGMVNESVLSMTGGEIHSNRNRNEGGGVQNHGTLTIKGGIIQNNTANHGGGISNKGSLLLSGGRIIANSANQSGGGLYIGKGTLELLGGDISKNIAKTGAGIYFNGTKFSMKENGKVHEENEVYLEIEKFIQITEELRTSTTVACIMVPDYKNGRKVAEVLYGAQNGSQDYEKYKLKSNQKFCLRPGDYQEVKSSIKAKDILISSQYNITYDKNGVDGAQDFPATGMKYWQEKAWLSEQKPNAGLIQFFGWSENANVEVATYHPGNTVPTTWNRDVHLYAVWGPNIRIVYVEKEGEGQRKQEETITMISCLKSGGYEIRKNNDYTKFVREGYQFAGWDVQQSVVASKAQYKEGKTNWLTIQELLGIATKQNGVSTTENSTAYTLYFYAIWDKAPVIETDTVSEYYEGTSVTEEMLLQNIKAEDEEDGDLTDEIRVVGIEYAAGKLVSGEKQKTSRQFWSLGMPFEERLDTWFMQLDKEDSPVTHTVLYLVRDSGGNETEFRWPVRIKYNEFPKIEVEDHFFTLEEAKRGRVTKERLLQEALTEKKLIVSDLEDDQLYPGEMEKKIEILNFNSQEFLAFENSGFVTITYLVKDSMGPEGEGKETQSQCIIHVVKDGEVETLDAVRYVRFINQKYYERNSELGEMGGLLPNSKWITIPEYKETIESAWASEERASEVWKFSKNDVEKLRKYVDGEGVGNSLAVNGLQLFLEEFASNCSRQ